RSYNTSLINIDCLSIKCPVSLDQYRPNGIVSRKTSGIDGARDLIARDVKELRRVYPDIPNSQLKKLIEMNKKLYPEAFLKGK
ncbi:hypothetical protein, partial [uncultured Vibrio sp.]|uniref:hypothetical protein n=1 Tax=uncultured Vibrio sp. TaxID=114054 RepID=UPI00261547AB